jgi:hypothetical protein
MDRRMVVVVVRSSPRGASDCPRLPIDPRIYSVLFVERQLSRERDISADWHLAVSKVTVGG